LLSKKKWKISKKVVLILSIRDGKPGVGHFVIDGNQIIFSRLGGDISFFNFGFY
jgi:hypothetical protein